MATSPGEIPGSVVEQLMRAKAWYEEPDDQLGKVEARELAVGILIDIVESIEETVGFAVPAPWEKRSPGWWKEPRKS